MTAIARKRLRLVDPCAARSPRLERSGSADRAFHPPQQPTQNPVAVWLTELSPNPTRAGAVWKPLG
jgi:hypothetical protein